MRDLSCRAHKQDLKTPPSRILELASHAGQLTKVLQEVIGEEGGKEWYMVEPSGASIWPELAFRAMADFEARRCIAIHRKASGVRSKRWPDPRLTTVPPKRIQTSPSHFLVHPDIIPLREQLDMVVSSGGLHWVGDIVGAC